MRTGYNHQKEGSGYTLLPAMLIVALMPVALSVSGCARSKESKAEPEVQRALVSKERLPDKPASNDIETPVPTAIKDQLLSADDVKDGAELEAETIAVDGHEKRLLISGHGRFLCGPTGNCPYWIFRETPREYEQEADLGVAQAVGIEKERQSFRSCSHDNTALLPTPICVCISSIELGIV